MISGNLSIRCGFKGPNYAIVTACTTGTHNIGDAARTIAYGDADVMVAGGAEMATTELGVGGFGAARALSTRNADPEAASRPWDAGRDGFVIGDGAGVLVLEEYEHAKARGAKIYCELAGYGMSGDAHHMTLPSEGGEGAQRCMVSALNDGKINPEQISYINAHGTSTPAGDKAETMAVKGLLGDAAKNVPMSSTKSMTGHLLGAAGGIEAVFSVLAIRDQVAPPTINLDDPDPECDLDYVPHTARDMAVDIVLSNSFGFGGTNVLAWLAYDGDRSLKQSLSLGEQTTLTVPAGANLKNLSRQLQSDGVIERAEYLYGYARFKKLAHRIKAGEYALDEQMTVYDLLDLLVQGKSVQYRLTLVEGWNMRQVREGLLKADRIKDDLSGISDEQLLAMLKLDEQYALPEGLFMPDTYQYTAGDTASAILRRANAAMVGYLEQAWEKRDTKSPLKSSYEALILASIVEKETGVASERATISGVFSRRLLKGMRLQTDPTVIYGIGPSYDGDIRRKDLTTDTPYNTYTRHGLPPTPIALAGREAIDAALHPEAGSSLYFVASGGGSHKFSDTLKQHEAAVRKYLLNR
eukprot:snap_masked-scaffold1_size3401120-processed-gene-24.21 protein:Tk04925 transcript:snap_masked-scaffold1_size3401120-processed-gene-24.21-mRNA-1 annotation:"3-oxoacyl-acp synthase"